MRAWRTGGYGAGGRVWAAGDDRFLVAGIVGVVAVSSALSLTRFLRTPEVSGRPRTVKAFYERVEERAPTSVAGRAVAALGIFLKWVNHYPSHIWLWIFLGHPEVYMWVWIALNGLYVGRGWIGLVIRFGGE